MHVLRRTLQLAFLGLSFGLVASWSLGRTMQSLLYGVTFSDPMTFATALAILTLITVLAGALPARRAAHLDPLEALRTE
jgi:ABC-type antimicrobial peptide transport system permease subunit